jgi:hypothetical protein
MPAASVSGRPKNWKDLGELVYLLRQERIILSHQWEIIDTAVM